MDEQAARTIRTGDIVLMRGVPHAVSGIDVSGIAGPYFRLICPDRWQHDCRGLTSYQLVGATDAARTPEGEE